MDGGGAPAPEFPKFEGADPASNTTLRSLLMHAASCWPNEQISISISKLLKREISVYSSYYTGYGAERTLRLGGLGSLGKRHLLNWTSQEVLQHPRDRKSAPMDRLSLFSDNFQTSFSGIGSRTVSR